MHEQTRSGPLVTVVIPAHNAEHTLRDTLASVRTQTYDRIEVVVVDDGSTDGTAGLLDASADENLRVIHQAQVGVAGARNAGIRAARGDIIAFLDADDRFCPDKLRRQVEALQQHPDVAACVVGMYLIDGSGRGIGLSHVDADRGTVLLDLPAVIRLFGFVTSALAVRRGALTRVGLFDESLGTAEDLDLIARLAAEGPLVEIRQPLVEYRHAEGSLSRRVFTGNRLRVLDKIARTAAGRHPLVRRAIRFTRARVAADYGDDLLWHGRSQEARGALWQSLRTRPSLRAAQLLVRSLLPAPVHAALRGVARTALGNT